MNGKSAAEFVQKWSKVDAEVVLMSDEEQQEYANVALAIDYLQVTDTCRI